MYESRNLPDKAGKEASPEQTEYPQGNLDDPGGGTDFGGCKLFSSGGRCFAKTASRRLVF